MYKIGYICSPDLDFDFKEVDIGLYVYPTLEEALEEKHCYPFSCRVVKVRIYLDKVIENGEYLLDS